MRVKEHGRNVEIWMDGWMELLESGGEKYDDNEDIIQTVNKSRG